MEVAIVDLLWVGIWIEPQVIQSVAPVGDVEDDETSLGMRAPPMPPPPQHDIDERSDRFVVTQVEVSEIVGAPCAVVVAPEQTFVGLPYGKVLL